MRFCLATPNRQAPGPQYWRYFTPQYEGDCKTEVLTLIAGAEEEWKLRSDDEILFGDSIESEEGHNERRKFLSVEEKIRIEELGDDLAEEANLLRAV
jgi:hypothetical protein